MAYIFGKDAKTYYTVTTLSESDTPSTVTWQEFTNITDESDNFTSEEIDITTRATAQSGFQAVAFGPKSSEITFGMLLDTGDALTQAVLDAWRDSTTIAMMFLTGDKDVAASFGVAANWSVSLTIGKPVKGVQSADVTLKIRDNVTVIDSDESV